MLQFKKKYFDLLLQVLKVFEPWNIGSRPSSTVIIFVADFVLHTHLSKFHIVSLAVVEPRSARHPHHGGGSPVSSSSTRGLLLVCGKSKRKHRLSTPRLHQLLDVMVSNINSIAWPEAQNCLGDIKLERKLYGLEF